MRATDVFPVDLQKIAMETVGLYFQIECALGASPSSFVYVLFCSRSQREEFGFVIVHYCWISGTLRWSRAQR